MPDKKNGATMEKDRPRTTTKEGVGPGAKGELRQEREEKGRGYYFNECQYGSFCRCLPLPEGADGSKAAATFKNGVLEITMPAPSIKESRPRRLEIKE